MWLILFDLRNGKQGGGNCVLIRQIICNIHSMRVGIAQPVQRLYVGCVVRGSNPTGGETVQTSPGAHAASFLGLNLPGRGVDLPPYLALRLRMIRTVLVLPLSMISWHFMGKT
jgi:hypothetical protein